MPQRFFHPKYWPSWCLLWILRLLVLLPYQWQLFIGRGLGLLIFWCVPRRRHIAAVNLALCFPKKTAAERQILLKNSFKNLGMGVMEALMAWFMSERRFKKIPFNWHGQEHAKAAIAAGKGIIAVGAHFSCLEIMARFFGTRMPLSSVYKASRNDLFEYIITQRRKRYMQQMVKHVDLKKIVHILREQGILWYAPDQDFGQARSVWTTWFGHPAATITGVSVLAKRTGALVVVNTFRRLPQGGYESITFPALTKFPSDNDINDVMAWQKIFEDFIVQYPEQYFWMHRRFKTLPKGMASVYTHCASKH
jgi:KDO2-lipid IV(A) lauroyltransferase